MHSVANPKVSICVIAYNQEKFIERCLQSILEQKVDFDYELIVSDDCSTDDTPNILRRYEALYPGKVKIILNTKNHGYFNNYIICHAAAKGDYVAHCDGDDNWFQGKLQYQKDYLDQHPDVAAVFSNSSSNGRAKYEPSECGLYRIEKIMEKVYTKCLCVHSSIMERRNYLDLTTLMDEKVHDFEGYWIRHGNALVFIDPVVRVNYEESPEGMSRQRSFIELLRPTVGNFKRRGMNARTMQRMEFDFSMLQYFSDPLNHAKPSFFRALQYRYRAGWVIKLLAPRPVYYAIKATRHPEIRPGGANKLAKNFG